MRSRLLAGRLKFTGIIIIGFLLGGASALLPRLVGEAGFNTAELEEVPSGEINDKKEIERLQRVFDTKGSVEAYEFFKTAYQKFGQSAPHILAHWVGIELFKREGMEGLAICDSSYDWGCYHGFLGVALTDGKKEVIRQAEIGCREGTDSIAFGACIHGIGHGLLGFTDYTENSLLSALQSCDALSDDLAAGSCYTGVFMEYNLRTMKRLEGNPRIREFDEKRPLEPCISTPEAYKHACYLELPSFWAQKIYDFSKMGEFCDMLSNQEFWETCYKGVARSTPSLVQYNKQEMGEKCNRLKNKVGLAFCVEEVVKLLIVHGDENPLELCSLLDSGGEERCIKESKEYLCNVLNECG